jgi:hypothetical protein
LREPTFDTYVPSSSESGKKKSRMLPVVLTTLTCTYTTPTTQKEKKKKRQIDSRRSNTITSVNQRKSFSLSLFSKKFGKKINMTKVKNCFDPAVLDEPGNDKLREEEEALPMETRTIPTCNKCV